MKDDLAKPLQQAGQAVTQVAKQRLAEQDFHAAIMQQITQPPQTTKRLWPLGLAAAVAALGIAWLLQQHQPETTAPMLTTAGQELQLDLYQVPMQVEQAINQTLLDEQQAIIQDLKDLKTQLLSI